MVILWALGFDSYQFASNLSNCYNLGLVRIITFKAQNPTFSIWFPNKLVKIFKTFENICTNNNVNILCFDFESVHSQICKFFHTNLDFKLSSRFADLSLLIFYRKRKAKWILSIFSLAFQSLKSPQFIRQPKNSKWRTPEPKQWVQELQIPKELTR